MLSAGQVRWAYVPFEDRPGGKKRPVLILEVLADRAIVLEGRSKWKDGLTLLLALDSGHADALRIQLWRATYFYAENLREIRSDDIERCVGTLSKGETERVIRELNEL